MRTLPTIHLAPPRSLSGRKESYKHASNPKLKPAPYPPLNRQSFSHGISMPHCAGIVMPLPGRLYLDRFRFSTRNRLINFAIRVTHRCCWFFVSISIQLLLCLFNGDTGFACPVCLLLRFMLTLFLCKEWLKIKADVRLTFI